MLSVHYPDAIAYYVTISSITQTQGSNIRFGVSSHWPKGLEVSCDDWIREAKVERRKANKYEFASRQHRAVTSSEVEPQPRRDFENFFAKM